MHSARQRRDYEGSKRSAASGVATRIESWRCRAIAGSGVIALGLILAEPRV